MKRRYFNHCLDRFNTGCARIEQILYALPNFAIGAALEPNLPYDPVKDFAGITQIGFMRDPHRG